MVAHWTRPVNWSQSLLEGLNTFFTFLPQKSEHRVRNEDNELGLVAKTKTACQCTEHIWMIYSSFKKDHHHSHVVTTPTEEVIEIESIKESLAAAETNRFYSNGAQDHLIFKRSITISNYFL
jgi:hypothetical protein